MYRMLSVVFIACIIITQQDFSPLSSSFTPACAGSECD